MSIPEPYHVLTARLYRQTQLRPNKPVSLYNYLYQNVCQNGACYSVSLSLFSFIDSVRMRNHFLTYLTTPTYATKTRLQHQNEA